MQLKNSDQAGLELASSLLMGNILNDSAMYWADIVDGDISRHYQLE